MKGGDPTSNRVVTHPPSLHKSPRRQARLLLSKISCEPMTSNSLTQCQSASWIDREDTLLKTFQTSSLHYLKKHCESHSNFKLIPFLSVKQITQYEKTNSRQSKWTCFLFPSFPTSLLLHHVSFFFFSFYFVS